MTNKLILPGAFVCMLGASLIGCNSSDITSDYEYVASSSTMVTGFSLTDDENVLDSLSNVFFSIDQIQGTIFNADSLPYGTEVDKLIPVITTAVTPSEMQLEVPRPGQSDSIMDFLTNSTDSVDFSQGPVTLRIKSESGTVERLYKIHVNVHQVKPDTLAWYSISQSGLPSSLSNIEDIRVVELKSTYYALSSSQGQYCLATTNDPSDSQWSSQSLSLAFVPKINTLRTSNDMAYILDENGLLYESADLISWSSTSQNWHYIYGGYENEIIGSKNDENGDWKIASYPSGSIWNMPENFPIEGTSLPQVFATSMAESSQLTMSGGRNSKGELLCNSWGFDGSSWACIDIRTMPIAVEGFNVVAYDLFKVPETTWSPVEYPALIGFGGNTSTGINRTVYLSKDWGMTWNVGPDLIQLPEDFNVGFDASCFVYSTEMHLSKSSSDWREIGVKSLPPHCWPILGNNDGVSSRIDKPITSWECPAIYLYGGYNSEAALIDEAWRGLIIRYTFAPKY